jgi:cytochrome oxidase Cu insertion factor (SCO1/SenC/PrrC family)
VNEQLEHIHDQPGPMTPERMAAIRAVMEKRDERAPKVGGLAPDFELPLLHGDGRTVRLSALRGRPVALIFGSYT